MDEQLTFDFIEDTPAPEYVDYAHKRRFWERQWKAEADAIGKPAFPFHLTYGSPWNVKPIHTILDELDRILRRSINQ